MAYKSLNSSMLTSSPKREAYFASRKYTGLATFYDSDDQTRPDSAAGVVQQSISNWEAIYD